MIRSIPTITTDRIYCKVQTNGGRWWPYGVGCAAETCVLAQQGSGMCCQLLAICHHPACVAHRVPPRYVQVLGQGAVHGAFAGYTDFTVGLVNT